jgi:phytoene dehydrogenase-like protein
MNRRQVKYDAIIIGGGHNGLTTTAYLSKAGLKVLVLEQRSVLGGCAATEEPFPGYKFDTGAHDAGLFQDDIVKELNLERYGLHFLESEAVVFAPHASGRSLTLWRDVDQSVEEISRFSPLDAQKFPDFVRHLIQYRSMLSEILGQLPPEAGRTSISDLWPWLRIGLKMRRRGSAHLMEFMRVIPLTVKEYLDEWFTDDTLKGVLAGPAIRGGMPGVQSAGTMLMFLYQLGPEVNGGCRALRRIKGGIGSLSTALAECARAHGAEIYTDKRVARILLDPDDIAATGVALAGGELIQAHAVISNADPKRTFFDFIGGAHLEPNFMREIANIRFRGSVAKVNLALDALPSFPGVKDERQLRGQIVISPSLDYLERAWDDAKYGRISRELYLEALFPTLMDPSLAPAGKQIMSITVQYAPYHLRHSDWESQRDTLADQVITTLTSYAPDLPDLILHRQIITPLDFESDYGLSEGQIYHGQMGLDQLLSLRPVPGYARYRTPFRNLYLCGAGNHPGGGVTGAPGRFAAKEMLLDMKSD